MALFASGGLVAAAPGNDDMYSPYSMGSSWVWTGGGSNVGATMQAGEPVPSAGVGVAQASVWWAWMPPAGPGGAGCDVEIDTFGSSFDTILAVYRDDGPSSWIEVASSNDSGGPQSKVSFTATGMATYRIAVYGYRSARGFIQLNLRAAPRGDHPDSALDLGGEVRVSTNGSNQGATSDGLPGEPEASIWYRWQAPGDGRGAVTNGWGFPGCSLAVYEQDSVSSNLLLLGSTNALSQAFDVQGGEYYFLAIGGTNPGDEGPFDFEFQFQGAGFDDFDGAADMGSASTWTTNASNAGATIEVGDWGDEEPNPLDRGGASVWFAWTAPTNGAVVVDTLGSGIDTVLGVYQGSDVFSLTEVAANDDREELGEELESHLVFEAYEGMTYHIAVHGYGGVQGPFTLNLRMPGRPANDDWTNAVDFGTSPSVHGVGGSNVGATWSPEENLNRSVWYRWTAPASGWVDIDLLADFDEEIAIHEFDGFGLNSVESSYGTFNATAGRTYCIEIGGMSGPENEDQGDFVIDLAPAAQHSNDQWPGAADLGSAATIDGITGSIETATDDFVDGSTTYNGIWYVWTAPVDGWVDLDVGADWFGVVYPTWRVYDLVDGELYNTYYDDWDGGFDAEAGKVYYIVVGCDNGLDPLELDLYGRFEFSLELDLRPRPANDDFADAAELGSATNATVIADNREATREFNESPGGEHSLWWRWQAPSDGELYLDLKRGDFQTLTSLYVGTNLSGLGFVMGFNFDNEVQEGGGRVCGGTNYYIRVDSWNSWVSGKIEMDLDFAAAPGNDYFSNSYDLGNAALVVTNGSNRLASVLTEPGEMNGAYSVWWTWTAPSNGTVSVNLDAIGYGGMPVARVYTGNALGDLAEVDYLGDSGPPGSSGAARFHVSAGTACRIAVYEGGAVPPGTGGPFELRVQMSGETPNDNFANAADLGSATNVTVFGDNHHATRESSEWFGGDHSVWWVWQAPSDGRLAVDMGDSSFRTQTGLYEGTNLSELAGSPDFYFDTWTQEGGGVVRAGTNYYFRVDSDDSAQNGEIALKLGFAAAPANDAFANAIDLGGQAMAATNGNNLAASMEEGELGGESGFAQTVWYRWTASSDGTAWLDFSSEADWQMAAVFVGTNLWELEAVAVSGEWTGEHHPAFDVLAGTEYQIGVYSGADWGGTGGDFDLSLALFLPPVNDDFQDATDLGGDFQAQGQGNNVAATTEPDEPAYGQRSAWWRWVAPADGIVRVVSRGGGDPVFEVFVGPGLASLTQVSTGDPWGDERHFAATAGTVYSIAFYNDYNMADVGNPGIDFELELFQRPANDDFSNAMDLGSATNAAATGHNYLATQEPDEAAFVGGGAQGVWWSWQAPADGMLFLDLGESSLEAQVGLFEGTSLSNLAGFPAFYFSTMSQQGSAWVNAGTNYHIRVDGNGTPGDILMGLELLAAPGNDDFENACDLGSSALVVTNGDNRAASVQLDDGEDSGNSLSVWWTWRAPANGEVSAAFDEASRDAAVFKAYTGDALSNLVEVSYLSDESTEEIAAFRASGGPLVDVAKFRVSAGAVYRFAVCEGVPFPDGMGGKFELRVAFSPAPLNDNFANAIDLGASALMETNGSTFFAAMEDGEGSPWGWWGNGWQSVWYAWTAPSDGRVMLTWPGVDHFAAVYVGPDLWSLTQVDEGDPWSNRAYFDAALGAQYRFGIYSYDSAADEPSDGDFEFALEFFLPPANDDFADAVDLGSGFHVEGQGNNAAATVEADEPPYGLRSAWWRWQAPADGIVRIDSDSSEVAGFAVFTGSDIGSLMQIAMPDPWGDETTFEAAEGAVYYIAFYNDYHVWDLGSPRIQFDLDLIPRPGNDDCADAIDLGNATNVVAAGQNFLATRDLDGPWGGDKSVWWAWRASANGIVRVDLDAVDGLWTPEVGVFAGDAMSNLVEVSYLNDRWTDPHVAEFRVQEGAAYRFAAHTESPSQADGCQFELRARYLSMAPFNDNFAGAWDLGSLSLVETNGSNRFATLELGEPTVMRNGWMGQQSVWFTWTAPSDGTAFFDVEDGRDQFAAVWAGTNLWDLVLVDSGLDGWDEDGALFDAAAGTEYRIAVYSAIAPASSGGGGFDFLLELFLPPANDNFGDAIDLGCLSYAVGEGNNAAATVEAGEPAYGQKSAWWRWQAPTNGIVRVVSYSDEQPMFEVYAGTNLASLVPVSMGFPQQDEKSFEAKAGTVYQIAFYDDYEVPGMGSPRIEFELELFLPPANDNFTNATLLASGEPADLAPFGMGTVVDGFAGSNRGATVEAEEIPMLPGVQAANSVWYAWTSPDDGRAFLDLYGGDVFAAVYAGSEFYSLNRIDRGQGSPGDDDRWFDTLGGTQYRIGIYSDGVTNAGGADFEFDLRFAAIPPNDDFAYATDLGSKWAVTSYGNNVVATNEFNEMSGNGASVWWKWTAPASGRATIDAGCEFDAEVQVSVGSGLMYLMSVATSTSEYDSMNERWLPNRGASFSVTEGTTYRIAIDRQWMWTGGRGEIELNVAMAPANDDLTNAVNLGSAPEVLTEGSNRGATAEGDMWTEWEDVRNSVWYQWKAPVDGPVALYTYESDFDAEIDVFTEDPDAYMDRPPGTPIRIEDLSGIDRQSIRFRRTGQERLRFEAERGVVYYISVAGEEGARGHFALRLTTAQANDAFENAEVLPSLASVTVTGLTYGATAEEGEPLWAEPWSEYGESAWWSWQAPSSGLVAVDTFGSRFDTVLGVFTGTNVAQLARVRNCDNANTNGTSRAAFFAQAGSNYHFQVSGSQHGDTGEGEVVMHVNVVPPAATAAGHLAWGRGYLEERSNTGLHAADDHFRLALGLDPSNAEANLLRGVTRFVLLQQEPEFEAMLNALGVVTVSNDVYHARYDVNTDTNGVWVPAAGAGTALPLDYVRSHVEPRLDEVRALWDRVTDSGFRTTFSDAETGSAFVQLDYGDALMLRGLPVAAKAAWTLMDTYNLAASLETACQMARDGQFDAQHVANAFQDVLEFRASGRREEFKTNFLAASDAYMAASDFIHGLRPAADPDTHLFSIEAVGSDQEFRGYLGKATNSLNGAVVQIQDDRIGLDEQISLADFVGTTNSIRDFAPRFRGNRVVAFSTPDVTFGGTWRNGSHVRIHDALRRNDLLYELSGFSAWADQNLAAVPEAQRGRDGNPDRDPLNNLLEYAFDLDPTKRNVAAEFAMPDLVKVTGAGAGQYLALTFVRRIERADLQYVVAVSDDLVTWDRTETQVEQWGAPVPTGDGTTEQVTYRLLFDVRFARRKFLRLEVIEVE